MSRKIVVVAPHPDDETLGCGGTLLRHRDAGDQITWIIMTEMDSGRNGPQRVAERAREITQVSEILGVSRVVHFCIPWGRIDEEPTGHVIDRLRTTFRDVSMAGPDVVYAPYWGDAHNDHAVTFDVVAIALKNFPMTELRVYDTPSETDHAGILGNEQFAPNLFVNVTAHMHEKQRLLEVYHTEVPEYGTSLRSQSLIHARMCLYGGMIGVPYAEAFRIVKGVWL